MKRREALSVGQIIEQAIAHTGNRDVYLQQQACFIWPDVVGPAINRCTTRRWVDKDMLHVCLTSAALKSELTFLAPQVVDNINRILGQRVISRLVIH